MKTKSKDLMMDKNIFIYIGMATLLLLMVPFLMIVFKIPVFDPGNGLETLAWDLFDFIVMGILLFSFGSIYVLGARKIKRENRIFVGVAVFFAFMTVWAELAVGALSRAISSIMQ